MKIYIAFILFIGINNAYAQLDSTLLDPQIGKSFPDFFLTDVHYYKKSSMINSDCKGKWLIMDIWDKDCGACIASFPKLNALQKKYSEKVKFVSIAYTGQMSKSLPSSEKAIKNLYERLRKAEHLELTVAYDSTLYNRFGVGSTGCPYIIFVDPEGIVRFVGGEIDDELITKIFENHTSEIMPIQRYTDGVMIAKPKLDTISAVYLIKTNAVYFDYSNDLKLKGYDSKDQFSLTFTKLENLYRFAYLGHANWDDSNDPLYDKYKYHPIFETKDSLIFKLKNTFYHYISNFPRFVDTISCRTILRDELQNYFGFIVRIETRKCPYLKLIIKEEKIVSNLKSKGGKLKFEEPYGHDGGFRLTNVSIKKGLINEISSNYQMHQTRNPLGLPIVDETGINYNIDIDIKTITDQFELLKKALNKNGFDLVLGYKDMQCIVISDPKPTASN